MIDAALFDAVLTFSTTKQTVPVIFMVDKKSNGRPVKELGEDIKVVSES